MPRPSRRQEIVEAATRTYAAEGYDGARIRSIAENAGMSEAAIYRHFGSMEELAQEVYAVNFIRYAELVGQAIHDGANPAEKIRNVVRATIQRYRDDKPAFIATTIRLPNFHAALPADTVYPIDRVAAVIREGQAAQVIRSGKANLLAAMFFGALLRPMLLAEVSGPGAFEMFHSTEYDQTIEEVSLATLFL